MLLLQDVLPPPPLALSMIVKDEAATITKTLLSLKDHISYWSILDTGSIDGTQHLIHSAMARVPGELASAPFQDFSTTRNQALRQLQGKAGWVVVMDGDHVLQGGWRLERAVARLAAACAEVCLPVCGKGLMIQRQHGLQTLYWTRVWNTAATGTKQGWHFTYPVHELPLNKLLPEDDQVVLYKYASQVVLVDDIKHSKSAIRWREYDLPVLEAERRAKPKDPRIAFYYAQTLDCLGEDAAAVDAYQARIDLGAGWWEETYMAMLRKGRVEARMPGRDPTESLLRAHAYNPARAEAMYDLALFHHQQVGKCPQEDRECCKRHHVLAYQYAKEAASRRREDLDDVLFVEEGVYGGWAKQLVAEHAWYAWDSSVGA